MKKPPAYTLPPVDDEAFALAVAALRAAVQHERRFRLKWAGRGDELRKADEFGALRRNYENGSYAAEKLREFAVDVLKAAVTRGRPFPESIYAYSGSGLFDKYGAEVKKTAELVRKAYAAADRTKIRFEVDDG